MLFKMTELKYQPNPVLARALDVLFILHADHEQNCSTTTMRTIGSSHVDPYSALAGAAAALYGPLHGGANEAVLRMLNEIGSVAQGAGLHQAREVGRRQQPADGIRPPRLQVVRPAREGDQEDRRPGVHGHRQEPAARDRARARADRAAGRLLRHAASSIRTSTSTPASSTRRWASRSRCSRCSSRSRARPAGSRSGKRCCSTPSRRLPGRGRSTPGPAARDYVAEGQARHDGDAMLPIVAARLALHARQAPATPRIRLEPRLGAPAAARGDRTAAGRIGGHRADAQVHQEPARGRRTDASSSRRGTIDTPIGTVHMVNLIATIPGAQQGPHRHRRPLRHEAVPRIPVRRRERRRIERGVPDRAGAGAQGAPERADDRAAVPRRRRSASAGMGRHRQHLRQPPLRRGRADATARSPRSRRSCSST